MDTVVSRRRFYFGSLAACLLSALASAPGAQMLFRSATVLPVTGGETQLIGSIVAVPGGAAEVISVPDGTQLNVHFYRFDTRMEIVAESIHAEDGLNFYGPSLCWDGAGFGVVASTLARAVFLILDADGRIARGPEELPGIPHGGRTAGFRVLWTGTHYAVFGMWLEKSNPFQDLSHGSFYTHLRYWLLNPDGSTAVHRELAMLAPITYPGIEGAEKAYYDVVWTGERFFLVYHAESESGPPLGGYYKMYDLQGNVIAGEQPIFAGQVTQGARLAWNGRTVAATGLKSVPMPDPDAGNHMFLRCFDPDGTPRGPERQYGQLLGFSPTVFAVENRFVTAYVMLHDWDNLGYALMLNAFDDSGKHLGPEWPAAAPDGAVVLGRMALGFDLQFTSGPEFVYGMAQTSDAWGITIQPISFALRNRPFDWPQLRWVRLGDEWILQWPDDAEDYQLLQTNHLNGVWAPVSDPPASVDGYKRIPMVLGDSSARFYRLHRTAQP